MIFVSHNGDVSPQSYQRLLFSGSNILYGANSTAFLRNLLASPIMQMEVIGYTKRLINVYHNNQHHILKDRNLQCPQWQLEIRQLQYRYLCKYDTGND